MSTRSSPPTPRRGRLHGAWVVAGFALIAGTALAEPGVLLKDSELRKEPLGSAEIVKQLEAKDMVDITARQGAWAGVNTVEGMAGWIRILNIRTGSGEKGRAGFGALASTFATGSSGQAVSTGVKGLTAAQLRKAAPNVADAEALAGYASSDADAAAFGESGQLQSQSIAYLPFNEGKGKRK